MKILTPVAAVLALGCAFSSRAYEIPNHLDMTLRAARISVLGDPAFMAELGLPPAQTLLPASSGVNSTMLEENSCVHGANYAVLALISCGGGFEDVPSSRSLNHFFDPTKSGNANDGGLVVLSNSWMSSPTWALVEDNSHGQLNAYSSARKFYFDALTKIGISSADRDAIWGELFQTLGQVIHHMQDMAQPQHVRNDAHCDQAECALVGQFNFSRYEKYSLNSRGKVVSLANAAAPTFPRYGMKLSTPRSFWAANGSGIAEFTNQNFVSQNTNFRMEGGIAEPNAAYSSPIPGATEQESVSSIFAELGKDIPPGVMLACRSDPTNCFVDFYSSTVTDLLAETSDVNHRASSFSVLDQDLQGSGNTAQIVDIGTGLTYSTQRVFSLNRLNFDAAQPLLIPRAVGYSAGLLNYFFRGRLAISLPDAGVYAVIDHTLPEANNPTTGGFGVVKLKIQNVSPTYDKQGNQAIDPQTNKPIYEPMVEGDGPDFVAVAKFHRNNCYQANLSGEFESLDPSLVRSCWNPDEEIVVSDPAAVPAGINSGPQEVTFTFTNKIPISATDLSLQVIYRGLLGNEPNAVVVETKDISEPTYAFNVSRWDQYLYAGYRPDMTTGGTTPFDTWCMTPAPPAGTSVFPSIEACDAANGLTVKIAFSGTPDPIPNYTPQDNPGAQDTFLDFSLERSFTPLVTSTAPVGTMTRVAWLTDASPTNGALDVTEAIDATHNARQFEWRAGTARAATVIFNPSTNTLTSSESYLPSRRDETGNILYVPASWAFELTAGDLSVPNMPPLHLGPSSLGAGF